MHAAHAAPPPSSIAPPPASARHVRAPLPPCPPAQPPRRAPRALAHRHRSLAPTHRHRGCAQATTRANLMRIAARRESLAEAPTTTANPHPHPHPHPNPHPNPSLNAKPDPNPRRRRPSDRTASPARSAWLARAPWRLRRVATSLAAASARAGWARALYARWASCSASPSSCREACAYVPANARNAGEMRVHSCSGEWCAHRSEVVH